MSTLFGTASAVSFVFIVVRRVEQSFLVSTDKWTIVHKNPASIIWRRGVSFSEVHNPVLSLLPSVLLAMNACLYPCFEDEERKARSNERKIESALFHADCGSWYCQAQEVKQMAVSRAEYLKVTAGLVTTAFAFIAGLAWNSAIQAALALVLGKSNSVPGLLTYAIIITIIAVLATVWIARAASRAAGEEIKPEFK